MTKNTKTKGTKKKDTELQLYKAKKIKIYPNKSMIKKFNINFYCNRYVYNYFLNYLEENYKEKQNYLKKNKNKMSKEDLKEFKKHLFPSYFDLTKLLPKLKKKESWLKRAESSSLGLTIKNLHLAYLAMFKGNAKHPKFKKRLFSFKTNIPTFYKECSIYDHHNLHYLRIPKLGWVFYTPTDHLKMKSIQNITISVDNLKNYYASVMYKTKETKETNIKNINLNKFHKDKMIGIDLGLNNFAILSNGKKIPTITFDNYTHKDILLMRKLSRRQLFALKKIKKYNHKHKNDTTPELSLKNFKNYQKMKYQVAKIKKHIMNKRLNKLHEITTYLVNNYDFIAIEDLNTTKMLKNKYLSKKIANASWRKFRSLLEYKCKQANKTLIVVPAYNTSKYCNNCDYFNNKKADMLKTTWICPNCKIVNDTDINAARNILDLAINIIKKQKEA